MSEQLIIAPDVFVTIRYSIFEDGQSTATSGAEELTESYVHGYGQVFSALEKGLEGKVSGAHLTVVAEPDDAFGDHDAEGIFEVDKEGLEGSDELVAGEEVVASGPEGDILMRIVEVRPDTLLVDTNHPLAGKRVRFEVDIVEVRAATDEEIEEAQQEAEDDGPCGCGSDHAAGDHAQAEGLIQLDPAAKKKVLS
ncbi:MAG: peptidylprolyl isomerase [Polyangiaceae bacterium]|nr:peptidylprolyl isomerase [Polyangiaceae bacterium]MBK8937788.1 peptidylprolyl isomerase [Polyangiaceae bacterium]